MACQVACCKCDLDNTVQETDSKMTCSDCAEEQFVARPCCVATSSSERFTVPVSEPFIQCARCHVEMVRLPCCEQYQPKMQLTKNIFDCIQCSKYSIACTCRNISAMPPKTMSLKCKKFNCSNFIVHCNCGRITLQELKSPYRCSCGFEYEYDIEVGVKI